MNSYSPVAAQHARPDYDRTLLWLAILLLGFGLVMVYSSSIAIAAADKHANFQESYYLVRQAVYLGVGTLFGLFAFQVPNKVLQEIAPYLFLSGLVLLVLVLIPGIGREVNGSRRWLSLLVINLQPSEFMKLFAVLYAADYTVRKAAYMDNIKKGFMPMFMVMLLVGGLLLREPDFGAFAVITSIAMAILFLGGMNWRLFAGLIAMLLIGFLVLIWTSPYRMQRIIGFMDPWADPFGKGYQLSHALIAFGRGEWYGVGLGASVEKLFYLPEAHTDFLLAVIAEELGFAGVAVVILLFVWLTVRAFSIGRQAAGIDRHFAALVAYGIGIWLAVQAIINMGVNMGLLPTKGLTLPLLSFGGSGIAANCTAIGVLLRVDWENRQVMKGYSV
ncbi:putative lipid II flippase FtsW [Sulfuricella sp.]|uniref:putative lipid II flippase FtsW n=1 Tax=Sulfuricella sp. TaxID=2099377 RepID=UPI002C239F93|nr:putative lipid II flippase FtsW [Sulfuricella sp.]HUX62879.1 putative lipid II flippase FtsW [Sulfuricella sp.]